MSKLYMYPRVAYIQFEDKSIALINLHQDFQTFLQHTQKEWCSFPICLVMLPADALFL